MRVLRWHSSSSKTEIGHTVLVKQIFVGSEVDCFILRVLSDRVEELEALRRRCTCKGEGVDKGEGVSRDIEEGHKGTGVAAVGESVDVRSMGSGVADVVSSGGDPGVERVVVDGKGGPVVGSQGTQSGEWSRVGGSRFWRPQPSKQEKGSKARTEEGV